MEKFIPVYNIIYGDERLIKKPYEDFVSRLSNAYNRDVYIIGFTVSDDPTSPEVYEVCNDSNSNNPVYRYLCDLESTESLKRAIEHILRSHAQRKKRAVIITTYNFSLVLRILCKYEIEDEISVITIEANLAENEVQNDVKEYAGPIMKEKRELAVITANGIEMMRTDKALNGCAKYGCVKLLPYYLILTESILDYIKVGKINEPEEVERISDTSLASYNVDWLEAVYILFKDIKALEKI